MGGGTGVINIYNKDHVLLESRHYHSMEGCRGIAMRWMDEYSDEGNYLQVAPRPYIKEERRKKFKPEEKKEVDRPPAIYTNTPVYNYEEKKNGHEK